MDISTISQFPFSSECHRELESLLGKPDNLYFLLYLDNIGSEGSLAKAILSRLETAPQYDPPNRRLEPILSLQRVANFLAAISTRKAELAKTVKLGLRSLGIESPRREPLKGQKNDLLYFECVRSLERAIEQTGLFDNKLQIKKHFGAKWRFEFERYLRRQKWPIDYYHSLCASRATPRTIAVKIASEIFAVSEDRIYRACLNASKSVKK